jgi:hypothetical protein
MYETWQHLLKPHTRGADANLTRLWASWSAVQSCLSLRRIVKWMCWRSNVFESSSARNFVRRPQKRTKCYNKHSEKQRWVGPRHLSGIPDLKITARPSTIADRFLWRGGSGASRVSSLTPDHESDCLHNRSATPKGRSSSETASQMVFRYLASAPRQSAMPRGPECQGILGQAQHPRGSPPTLLTRFGLLRLLPLPHLKSTLKWKRFQDVEEIQLNTTQQLQAIPKQAYQTCNEKRKDRWNRCIQSGGSYFEGETSSNL